MFPLIPYDLSLPSSLRWEVSFNALVKSNNIVSTTHRATIVSIHLSRYANNCGMVDCPFMKPYCLINKRSSTFISLIVNSLRKDSVNVHTLDVTLMALKFWNITETYAIFHVCGNIHYPWFCLKRELEIQIHNLLILVQFVNVFHQVRMICLNLVSAIPLGTYH